MVFLICTCYTVFSVAVQYITVTSITSTDCLRCCICRSRSRCLCCAVSGGLSECCAVKWSNHYLPLRVRRASLTAGECCSTHYQLQLNNNNKLFLLYSLFLSLFLWVEDIIYDDVWQNNYNFDRFNYVSLVMRCLTSLPWANVSHCPCHSKALSGALLVYLLLFFRLMLCDYVCNKALIISLPWLLPAQLSWSICS